MGDKSDMGYMEANLGETIRSRWEKDRAERGSSVRYEGPLPVEAAQNVDHLLGNKSPR